RRKRAFPSNQNLASCAVPLKVIQKLRPSLQAPSGNVPTSVERKPRGLKSAAFHRDTVLEMLVTRTRSPSKAVAIGLIIPLPVSVWRTSPEEARTIETLALPLLGTQMFVPSKTGCFGEVPTGTVCAIPPAALSLKSEAALSSVTHTLAPSKRAPLGLVKPEVTVVTVQGMVAPGVTIETEGTTVGAATQKRDPS